MAKKEKSAAKIRVGIYMCSYETLITHKQSTLIGTKSEVKARLKTHGGLKNKVLVLQWDGKVWVRVLFNSDSSPVNTLFTEDELWDINTKNINFDHLEDFFWRITSVTKHQTQNNYQKNREQKEQKRNQKSKNKNNVWSRIDHGNSGRAGSR